VGENISNIHKYTRFASLFPFLCWYGHFGAISSTASRSLRPLNSSSLQLDHKKTGEASPPVINIIGEDFLYIIRFIGRQTWYFPSGMSLS
jgi:hypothetical protein